MTNKNSPEDILAVHAVGVGFHCLDADFGFVGEEDVDLVGGTVFLGFVDGEIFALHVVAVLGFELVTGHVDLEVADEVVAVAEHLHHRLADTVEFRYVLLRQRHLLM